jgi:hypothetical protein
MGLEASSQKRRRLRSGDEGVGMNGSAGDIRLSVGALLSVALVLTGCARRPPSDQSVVEHFRQAKPALDQLRQTLITGSDIATDPEGKEEDERRPRASDTLPALSEQAGVKRCALLDASKGWNHTEVRCLLDGAGFAGRGWRVAYVWRDTEPERQIRGIDEFWSSAPRNEEAYRPMGDGWYVSVIR